ncbi:MAG: hypothetical protein LBP39_03605, partial [Rickettsiales bacterium]|nr:hypothetical protein [Rickettsiales bacterium]
MSDSAKNYDYEVYRIRFIHQYIDEIDRFLMYSTEEARKSGLNTDEMIKNNLSDILDIIWSNRIIEPRNDIGDDKIFFETDLQGDMRAFLNTLCETGAVKYKDGEEALIFYNPEVVNGEQETYTLSKLEALKNNKDIKIKWKHMDLMKKLQPLPNVEPTNRYSQYVNCGNFMNWGKQSEQMIHMINYLNGQCKGDIKPAKLIMGSQELFYLDGCSDAYVWAGGICMYGCLNAISNKSAIYSEKIKSLEKAVKKAVASGTRALAQREG